MLKAYANTASKQRLAKYRMQHRWGVPEGDTRLAHTDRQSIRMVRLLQRLHLFVFFGAAAAVAVGQVLGTARSGERFAFSRSAFAAFMMRDVAVLPVFETPCQRRPPPIWDIFSAVC